LFGNVNDPQKLNAKLTDFGSGIENQNSMSLLATVNRGAKSMVGTLPYFSPEMN